jgi:menaquinol-cytochrome c reductase iron-sulfur subunit
MSDRQRHVGWPRLQPGAFRAPIGSDCRLLRVCRMEKSLNFDAVVHPRRPSPAVPSPSPPMTSQPVAEAPRRNVLVAFAATVIGGLVGIVPFAAGLATFLDPLVKLRARTGGAAAAGSGHPLRRVAALSALPADGTPVQVPVIADLTDAWNRESNQPIGAVYLRRQNGKVECFNAICPHAGCFVAYSADRKVFQCPCHTSSFELDGQRILPSPSPRNMDALKVDAEKLKADEVWVEFVNYYPGKEHQEEKA